MHRHGDGLYSSIVQCKQRHCIEHTCSVQQHSCDSAYMSAVLCCAVKYHFGIRNNDCWDDPVQTRISPAMCVCRTRQTLSFKPTTVSGQLPGPQRSALLLQPSAHKARPSGGSVLQVKQQSAALSGSAKVCNPHSWRHDDALLVCVHG